MADHLEDSTLVSKTPKIILWLLLAFTFFLIGFISNFLFASTIDAQHYAFNVTWLDSAKTNYSELNGRWAQGFTNDYRFYVHRVLSTLGVNIFFFFSIWYFFSALLRKFAFVVAGMFYFAFILNCFNYYQIAYLLNTSLSYTFGVSLMFVLYGWIIRNKSS